MKTAQVVVTHDVGLHARPASEFVKLASQFPCDVTVRNITKDSKEVNAKSMLSVLTLAVGSEMKIEISATGDQETQAVLALVDLVERNFKD